MSLPDSWERLSSSSRSDNARCEQHNTVLAAQLPSRQPGEERPFTTGC